jgi:hypothetical protein
LVEEGARELAGAGAAVAGQLGWAGPVPTALAGGLLLGSEGYRARVLNSLQEAGVNAGPVTLVKEPAEGAVRRACAARVPL